jgi:hypothetical protein
MATLAEIEAATKRYAASHRSLSQHVSVLNSLVERTKRRRLPYIKQAVARAAEDKAALAALIDGSRPLFDKPKTVIFDGVKVGLQKSKGRIEWDDDEHVVRLIRRHFPEQFDTLVKTTEKPLKTPMTQLTVAELRKIGCEVEEAGEVVTIKPVDSDVDKIVAALLKGAESEEA